MKNPRIVFMGTPEFAVATLGSLLMNGFNVVGVVTVPDKPAGRGRKITMSPVKTFANDSSLKVLQPANLKDAAFLNELKELAPDYIIVVAFRKLPEAVWALPRGGTINLHASLLPHYRGAAPINHVIINGEQETGITTFFINEKIDTGEILLRESVPVYNNENAGDLHNRLMKLGALLVVKTLKGLTDKSIKPQNQNGFLKQGELPKEAPKIFPSDCVIDWNQPVEKVHNLIRGLSPYPCARSGFKSKSGTLVFKIFESRPEPADEPGKPGTIVTDNKNYLRIACKDGWLTITSLQIEGKKRLGIQEFLRGFSLSGYTIEPNLQVS
ncbi:MAG: methionyl-tRNA formyltransferase [Bacteroidales bacterium]